MALTIKLVEITRHRPGWKGTWYETGQRHFVTEDARWPAVVMQRWAAVDICGGINEADCREIRGLSAWTACRIKQLKISASRWH